MTKIKKTGFHKKVSQKTKPSGKIRFQVKRHDAGGNRASIAYSI